MSETIRSFLEQYASCRPQNCLGMERFQGLAQRPHSELSATSDLLGRARALFDGASTKRSGAWKVHRYRGPLCQIYHSTDRRAKLAGAGGNACTFKHCACHAARYAITNAIGAVSPRVEVDAVQAANVWADQHEPTVPGCAFANSCGQHWSHTCTFKLCRPVSKRFTTQCHIPCCFWTAIDAYDFQAGKYWSPDVKAAREAAVRPAGFPSPMVDRAMLRDTGPHSMLAGGTTI